MSVGCPGILADSLYVFSQKVVKPQGKAVKAPPKKAESSDSDSDSSSEDEAPKNQKPKTAAVAAKAQAKVPAKTGIISIPTRLGCWGPGDSGDWCEMSLFVEVLTSVIF